MDHQDYVRNLKRRQIEILKKYRELIVSALSQEDLMKRDRFILFQDKEKILMHKLEHLEKVISAFPSVLDLELDGEVELHYRSTRKELHVLMERLQKNKSGIKRRIGMSKLNSNRGNRLYREVNPSYIDIRT